jgi:hypothetical protein
MRNQGWMILVVAMGAMFGLIGAEIVNLQTMAEMYTPAFIGKSLIHLGTVIGAYFGGKKVERMNVA